MPINNPCECQPLDQDTYTPIPSPCLNGCLEPIQTDCIYLSNDITICGTIYHKDVTTLSTLLSAMAIKINLQCT